MIVGSIYLGKKAKKAYRKHQAEKVAKQLTNGIDIVDPSDEIVVKAPPASPVDKGLSPSSTYSDDWQGSGLSSVPSSERYAAASQRTSSPSSTRSSPWPASAAGERSSEFARFNARDPDRMLPNQPPSYDSVVNSPLSSHTPMTAQGSLDSAPAPFIHYYQAHNPAYDGCPTCVAMMQHHQHHQPHFHSTYPGIPGHGSWDGVGPAELHTPKPPAVSELPAQPVHPPTKELQSMAEMPDTSKTFELPAELPAHVATMSIGDTDSQDDIGVKSAGSSKPVELPSETTDSEADETSITEDIDVKVDRAGEWQTADPART